MDDQTYQFASALLAARQVDRDLAEMICQQCKDGAISFDQAIESLRLMGFSLNLVHLDDINSILMALRSTLINNNNKCRCKANEVRPIININNNNKY